MATEQPQCVIQRQDLSRISIEMLADINKDTVDFVPNFDETEKEPDSITIKISKSIW